MMMSPIIQQNINIITNYVNEAIRMVMASPMMPDHVKNMIQQALGQNAFNDVIGVLSTVHGNSQFLNMNEVVPLIYKIVNRSAGMLISNAGGMVSAPMAEDIFTVNNLITQFSRPSYGYQQQQQPYSGNGFMNNGTNQFNGPSAFVSVNSNADSTPVNKTGLLSPFGNVQHEKQETQMNNGIFEFQNAAIPEPKNKQIIPKSSSDEMKNFKRIQLKNVDLEFTNKDGVNIASTIYNINDDALEFPLLIEIIEYRWAPIFNVKDSADIVEVVNKLFTEIVMKSGSDDIDTIIRKLKTLDKKYSIKPFIDYVDVRISHYLELILVNIYNLIEPMPRIPSYFDSIDEIDVMLNNAGICDSIKKHLTKFLISIISSFEETEISYKDDIKYKSFEIMAKNMAVTLPFNLRHSYIDNTITSTSAKVIQIHDIIDQAFNEIKDENVLSIVVFDISNNRYRVMKNMKTGYSWYFMGF